MYLLLTQACQQQHRSKIEMKYKRNLFIELYTSIAALAQNLLICLYFYWYNQNSPVSLDFSFKKTDYVYSCR